MSKGSNRRRPQVSREEYERRWAETFGARVLSMAEYIEMAARREVPTTQPEHTYAEPDATGYP